MAEFGEEAVAGMAIVARMTPVAFGVLFALSGAVGPIIGQNHGGGRPDRVRRTFTDALLFTAVVVVAVTAILFALRGPVADLFDASGITRDLVFLFCGPLALAFFFNGVIFVSNAAFNNLGHPFYSTWINWGRHTLGTIPPVMLGAALLGAPGVLIGQAAGGILFAGIAVVLSLRVMARGEAVPGTPTEPFLREARLFQLFHHRR
jgi:Na+-driven multidrug efflux pump